MSRYIVIGASGSGKSTLARAISKICSIPYVDTDAIYWKKDWSLRSDVDVIKALPLESSSWVIDGNFTDYRKEVWSQADTIIWLNVSPFCVLWRVVRRNISWCILGKSSWTAKRMPLKIALSGIRHSVSQIFRHRKFFPGYLEEFKHKKIIIICCDDEYKNFLTSTALKK